VPTTARHGVPWRRLSRPSTGCCVSTAVGLSVPALSPFLGSLDRRTEKQLRLACPLGEWSPDAQAAAIVLSLLERTLLGGREQTPCWEASSHFPPSWGLGHCWVQNEQPTRLGGKTLQTTTHLFALHVPVLRTYSNVNIQISLLVHNYPIPEPLRPYTQMRGTPYCRKILE